MILMIYTSFSTFVKLDFEILSKKFSVKCYLYDNKKSIISHLINQLKLIIWLLNNIKKCDAVYIWFADYHSFFPILFSKLFNKKSFLVLGGYDVAYLPELNYGSQNNLIRSFAAKYSVKNTFLNLAVSKYVLNAATKMVSSAKLNVLYNGFNSQIFFDANNQKENLIVTVGIINSKQRIKLKGIDLFVEAARNLPEYKFTVIGINKDSQKYFNNIPQNLNFIEMVKNEELAKYYQKAKVYCQFSKVESFGLSVVEAMACGCVSVVSNNGALPEIVGENGIVVNNSADEIILGINYAVNNSNQLRKKSSNYVLENYDFKIREEKLLSIINNQLSN